MGSDVESTIAAVFSERERKVASVASESVAGTPSISAIATIPAPPESPQSPQTIERCSDGVRARLDFQFSASPFCSPILQVSADEQRERARARATVQELWKELKSQHPSSMA